MGKGSLGPSSNAAGLRGQGQVPPSRCAPFRSGESTGRGPHLPCAALAVGSGVCHPSTRRLWALGGPGAAHTPEPLAHPLWPLYPVAGSGNPPEGLQG